MPALKTRHYYIIRYRGQSNVGSKTFTENTKYYGNLNLTVNGWHYWAYYGTVEIYDEKDTLLKSYYINIYNGP